METTVTHLSPLGFSKADGYNGTRLPLRETRPGRPQAPQKAAAFSAVFQQLRDIHLVMKDDDDDDDDDDHHYSCDSCGNILVDPASQVPSRLPDEHVNRKASATNQMSESKYPIVLDSE